ncbi:hypothetical protein G6L16_000925 [Agrobacterium tumefaciens]|uniref:hypothetical protein n=1 Tax=Agrobacterium tumefaciens TaxID=358 RepID=UPI0015745790|nr:hypothetical protein [Agrobacterium tumefaciens]NSZ61893.1 hypothetical protein [Agrobacterium tumefaciens]NTA68265.1 hypothetical protein [Agrobacterium tumefaciens]WIE38105.1 hypothetical protein G6L16_000925 [Agrobacterium tumefaciens]
MNDRFQFWANPASWPDDAYGFVFLARAIDRIGKATFAGEWTGTEPVARPPIQPPNGREFNSLSRLTAAKEDFQREIAALIWAANPKKLEWETETVKVAGSLSGGGGRSHQLQVLAKDAMSFGVGLVLEENKKRVEAGERWSRILTTLKDALRDGRLEFVTLPTRGGAFSASHPKEWWNVPDIANRVAICRMNPAVPFCPGFDGNGYEHIFVKEADLERLLPQPQKPKTSADVKDIYARAGRLYDRLEREGNGHVGRENFDKACWVNEKIRTTHSRPVYTLKLDGEFEEFYRNL